MEIFDLIARERHTVADMLADLSAEQLRTQSLCTDWTACDFKPPTSTGHTGKARRSPARRTR